ncbi:MAG: hypothetical protein OXH99_25935 [Bryobacterales bacterium]|nr:hypothetical protein [Bryobacterales bacterium]
MLIRESGLDCAFHVAVAILLATVGVPLGQAQIRPMDLRADTRQETPASELELQRQLEAAYEEARRATAHARLGSSASAVEP